MLNISDNSIGNEGIKTLLDKIDSSMVNLIYVNLSNNDLGYDCIPELKVLLESESLMELKLANNNLTDGSIDDLSLVFYTLKCKLRKLDLSSNRITSKGCSKLLQSLKQNEFLTHLNLEDNPNIGNNDLEEMTMFFKNNEVLQYLNMANCGLEEYHIKDMVEGLHANNLNNFKVGNQTVSTLVLSHNHIKTKGVKHLCTLIENDSNKGIKVLELASNMISDEGGVAIASALATNSSVNKINLKDNILKEGTGMELCEAMKTNKTILKLNLDKNSIKCSYLDEIKSRLTENQELVKQKLLPEAYDEMVEQLKKEEEQLIAGDKDFDFSKPNL